MKRVLETHGGRLRDEERTIAANGIKETVFGHSGKADEKHGHFAKVCVCVIPRVNNTFSDPPLCPPT